MPSTAEVITGGPSSSGPAIPPCAYAREANMPAHRSATMVARKAFRIIVPATISDCLDVSANRPHGEVAPYKLTDPITEHRQRAAKEQRHVLCLPEKAAQRAAFNMPHVFRGLGADISDALDVGDRKNVVHELHRLQERSERNVVEAPYQHRPYRSADKRRQHETLRSHQQPVQNDCLWNSGNLPDEIHRKGFSHVPLEVPADPRGHEKAYAGVGRAGGKAPCDPLYPLERGGDDDGGEGGNDGPPLRILPIGPEIPVAGEQKARDIRRSRDDENGGDPEYRVPGAIEPLVLGVQQVAKRKSALSLGRRGHRH